MDCLNHAGRIATAYCQSCGKPLCEECIATKNLQPAGTVLCSQCLEAWQGRTRAPFVPAPPPSTPSPAVAAGLGFIPGVGAMYNGQFIKGLIHVVIFAVLISAAQVFSIFGLFIAAWIAYQVFEAYHTAKARRNGLPLPDPLGLNELGNWFSTGTPQPPPPGEAQGAQAPPYQAAYQAPPQNSAQAGFTGAGIPPMPPPPQAYNYWRRSEPVGAIVLIVLGVLFALGQMDIFSDHIFEYSWPVLLIALGVWLIVRRIGDAKGDNR